MPVFSPGTPKTSLGYRVPQESAGLCFRVSACTMDSFPYSKDGQNTNAIEGVLCTATAYLKPQKRAASCSKYAQTALIGF